MVLESKINNFFGKIELGVQFFKEAGMLLVQMKYEDPNIFERIIKSSPPSWVTLDVLSVFESIGNGALAVETMFLPKHVISRLIGLPVEKQIEIATAKVEVVNPHREANTRFKKASDLTFKEAKILIGSNGIRPISEQRKIAQEIILEEGKLIGFYEVTIMNGKPFLKQVSSPGSNACRVFLRNKKAIIQFLE